MTEPRPSALPPTPRPGVATARAHWAADPGVRHPTPAREAPRALHEHAFGAAFRAIAWTLGLAPFLAWLALSGVIALPPVVFVAGALLFGGLAFGLERRGRWAFPRAALAGGLTGALLPLLDLAARHLGHLDAGLRVAEALPGMNPAALALSALSALVTSPVWALAFLVRARTTRAGPQVAAGAVSLGTLGALLAIQAPSPALGVVLAFASGALALALVTAAEARLGPRLDPNPPRPVLRPLRGLAVLWAPVPVLALLVGLVDAHAMGHGACCRTRDVSAIGALKTLAMAQTLHREADKDGDGALDYASSLAALGALGLIDPVVAGGTNGGYTFRLARDEAAPTLRWCAAADPVVPGTTGERRFWVSEAGVIYYARATTTPPPALAPAAGPPAGWQALGK